jgi:hypothetical protein
LASLLTTALRVCLVPLAGLVGRVSTLLVSTLSALVMLAALIWILILVRIVHAGTPLGSERNTNTPDRAGVPDMYVEGQTKFGS